MQTEKSKAAMKNSPIKLPEKLKSKLVYAAFFLILSSAIIVSNKTVAENTHQQASIGDVFPLDLNAACGEGTVNHEAKLKLVVFMPYDSEYEGMLDLSLTHYFLEQGAFATPLSNRLDIQKIYIKSPESKRREIIVESKPAAEQLPKEDQVALGTLDPSISLRFSGLARQTHKILVPSDCSSANSSLEALKKDLGKPLDMVFPKLENTAASLFLLDDKNIIQWRDDDYQAQGEHLKPLERKIKSLLGTSDPVAKMPSTSKPLEVGEFAPNVKIGDHQRLSDLKGKTVLMTFYPAAFSGTLSTGMSSCAMCCSVQIISLAESHGLSEFTSGGKFLMSTLDKSQVERLAITSATPVLLTQWAATLKTGDTMRFVNDPDYAIAQAYASYDHDKGYNRRTVFIVDKQGKIAFIDWDYTREDTAIVQKALDTISLPTVKL
jgi:peroxiredoxin